MALLWTARAKATWLHARVCVCVCVEGSERYGTCVCVCVCVWSVCVCVGAWVCVCNSCVLAASQDVLPLFLCSDRI